MIKMISGTTRIGKCIFTPADGAFDAPAEVEDRLTELGAAVHVAQECVATTDRGETPEQNGVNIPADEDTAECEETAVVEYGDLLEMKMDELKALAAEFGINTKGLRSKSDLAYAIAQAQEAALAGNSVPTIGVEEPVV